MSFRFDGLTALWTRIFKGELRLIVLFLRYIALIYLLVPMPADVSLVVDIPAWFVGEVSVLFLAGIE